MLITEQNLTFNQKQMFRQKTKLQKQEESLHSMLEFSDMISKRKAYNKYVNNLHNDDILKRLIGKKLELESDIERRIKQIKDEYLKFYDLISL